MLVLRMDSEITRDKALAGFIFSSLDGQADELLCTLNSIASVST